MDGIGELGEGGGNIVCEGVGDGLGAGVAEDGVGEGVGAAGGRVGADM